MSKSSKNHVTQFTYREFINYVVDTPIHKNCTHEESKEKSQDGWHGTKTWEEALEYARTGWDAGIEQLDIEDGLEITGGVNFTPDVQGSAINMGDYLMGLPTSMYNVTEEREFNMEEITVFYQPNYTADFDADDAIKYTNNLIKVINKLQSNHNVRLVASFNSSIYEAPLNGAQSICHVLIKDVDERFVLNSVAFSMHPSFFRRFRFGFIEKQEYWYEGYGSSAYFSEFKRASLEYAENNNIRGKILVLPSLQEYGTDCDLEFAFETRL